MAPLLIKNKIYTTYPSCTYPIKTPFLKCLKSLNVFCKGLRKHIWWVLITKIYDCKFCKNFVIYESWSLSEFELDWDSTTAWIQIRIQQNTWIRFSKIPGSGFTKYGSKTVVTFYTCLLNRNSISHEPRGNVCGFERGQNSDTRHSSMNKCL